MERDGRWLFLEGGPRKWFAGRLNGLGGGVEPGEDVESAAHREAREETGLEPIRLDLRATVHVAADPPVMLFVFTGVLPPGELCPSSEGVHHWLAPDAVLDSDLPFVDDLRELVPRLRDSESAFHLHRTPRGP